jgi:phosphoribosylaminoimidazole carboxylase
MMALEAPRLNIRMEFLDANAAACPASAAVGAGGVLQGSLHDASQIGRLSEGKAVVTVEIEHVNAGALAELESRGVNVQPSSRVLATIQDKYLQKQHFAERGISLPPFVLTSSVGKIQQAASSLGLPLMLKSRRGGYDGRGNAVLRAGDEASIEQALKELGAAPAVADANKETGPSSVAGLDLYAEGWVDFACEIAVMVVRSSRPAVHPTRCYPAVNAIQQDSICRVVLCPARGVSQRVRDEAQALAVRAVDALGEGASGVFGVEMFVTRSEQVLLNEVAPRPHNTGHYTQNACVCSQFENHLRGICGLPLGSTEMIVESAAMVNVLGASSGSMDDTLKSSSAALAMPRASVHWYSKVGGQRLRGRKMGHINLVGSSQSEIDEPLSQLLALEGIPVSLMPGGRLQSAPLVGVIMGSQSDLPTMHAAVEVLREFGVPCEVDIVSAHRTPDKLLEYSRSAAGRGVRVIVAGAGGAAHLPGMQVYKTGGSLFRWRARRSHFSYNSMFLLCALFAGWHP